MSKKRAKSIGEILFWMGALVACIWFLNHDAKQTAEQTELLKIIAAQTTPQGDSK